MKKETKYFTLIRPVGITGSWDNIDVPARLLEKPFQDFINRGVAEIIRVTAVVEVELATLLDVQTSGDTPTKRRLFVKPDFIQLSYFDNFYPIQIVPNGEICSIKLNTDFANNPILKIMTDSLSLNSIVSISNNIDAADTSIFKVISPRVEDYDLRLTIEYTT